MESRRKNVEDQFATLLASIETNKKATQKLQCMLEKYMDKTKGGNDGSLSLSTNITPTPTVAQNLDLERGPTRKYNMESHPRATKQD